MKPNLLSLLQQHENLTTTAHLRASGFGRSTLDRYVADGRLIRVCRGWVATTAAYQDAVIAVLHRGKLAGPSALASRGTWDALASRLHVQRTPNSHGIPQPGPSLNSFRPRDFMPSGVVTRWRPERYADPAEPPWRQSVIDALLYVAKFADYEQFIACVDSALYAGTLGPRGLAELTRLLPARFAHYLDDIEPRSEAGIETLSRVRLNPIVRLIQPQFQVPGISQNGGRGRVDLLIDGWLAFEADGDGWHDPAADRLRDQKLILRGLHPVHFGFHQIVNDWPRVEATVLELLRYPPRNGGAIRG